MSIFTSPIRTGAEGPGQCRKRKQTVALAQGLSRGCSRAVTGPRFWAGGLGLEADRRGNTCFEGGSATLLPRGLDFLPAGLATGWRLTWQLPTLGVGNRGRGPPGERKEAAEATTSFMSYPWK